MDKNKISDQDLKFIKSYYKKNYSKEQDLVGNEFDVVKRQAPLKTFKKVNEKKNTNYKYSFKKHLDRLYSNLSKERVMQLIPRIDEVNEFTLATS